VEFDASVTTVYKVVEISTGGGNPWAELYCHRNPMQYFAESSSRLNENPFDDES